MHMMADQSGSMKDKNPEVQYFRVGKIYNFLIMILE